MIEDGSNQEIELANDDSIIIKVYNNALGNNSGEIVITGPNEECSITIPFEISEESEETPPEVCVLDVQPDSMAADGQPHDIAINLTPVDYLDGNYAINLKNVGPDRQTLGNGEFTHEDRPDVADNTLENVRPEDKIAFSSEEAGYVIVELLSDTIAQVVDCSDEIVLEVPTEPTEPYIPPEETEPTEPYVPPEEAPTEPTTEPVTPTTEPTTTTTTTTVEQPTQPTTEVAPTGEAAVVHPGPEEIGGDTGPEVIIYLGLLGLGYFIFIRIRKRKYNN